MDYNTSVCRCDRCGCKFSASQHDNKSLCKGCQRKQLELYREHEREMQKIEERRRGK